MPATKRDLTITTFHTDGSTSIYKRTAMLTKRGLNPYINDTAQWHADSYGPSPIDRVEVTASGTDHIAIATPTPKD